MLTKLPFFLILVPVVYTARAVGRELPATPANLRQQVAALQPGDTLMLQPGKYSGGIWLKGLHGRPDTPITIRGQGPQTVLLGREGTNTVDLSDCQWLVLRDLTFDGQGKEVDAIKAGKETTRGCHHITIENNTIINHGANQQIVGISTKSPCSDWIIRGNTILGAGTGIYMGNSDGNQPFVRGTIEYNLIRDPVGYCMQIKHQNRWPDIEALPRGPSTTIIRYNVFIKGDRPSLDGNRPNLLVDGFPDEGPGSQDRYQVYGNVLFHNPRESLFQATGRVSIHDNVFADAPGTAVAVLPHAGKSPRQVFIYHNTFVGVGRAIAVSGTPKEAFAVAANLWVADQKPSQPWPAGNVRLTTAAAAKIIVVPVPQLGKLDVQPHRLIPATVPLEIRGLLQRDMDYDRDFWGNLRDPFDQAGACQPALRQRPIEAQRRVLKPPTLERPFNP
ncbi:MAG: hypothetical protein ABSG68_11315 [Thermoguttaceae bacterium]|jgi:hypothetical protein